MYMRISRFAALFSLFIDFLFIPGGFIMLFLSREDGQGLAEYALLIAFIAIVLLVILGVFGQQLRLLFEEIVTCLPAPSMAACFGG